MRNQRPSGRRKKRLLKRILLLLVAAAVGVGAWTYLKPLLSESSVTIYERYTVARGDIQTTKSFSATLSVGESETLYNDSGAESIRQLYVSGGQEVREGDKLMELSNGTVLEAGIDGVVNEIRYSAGDWLRPNAQLVEICDLENLQVSLSVDEYDVENISAGQMCTITIVPLGMEFETELRHVSRLSSATGRVAYYTATAELTVPEEVLPGMTASVTMLADSAQNVLLLDVAALSFDETGAPYVLRKDGESYERVPVQTGLNDGMRVEILSGLSEGEEVWVAAGTEAVQADFSLSEIYKQLFGETVVINPESGASGGRNRSGFDRAQMPDGDFDMSQLPEGFDMNQFPGGQGFINMATPADMAPPEGMTIPDGMEMPEGGSFPSGGKPSRGEGGDAAGGQHPGQQESMEETNQQGSDGE